MLKTWVKNVYSLCVQGVVNSAKSYTASLPSPMNTQVMGVKPTHFTHFLDNFPPSLYTPKIALLSLETTHLCTLSTVPTINKTNKK